MAQFMLILLASFVLRICPSIPHAVKKLKTKQTLEGFCCPNGCVQRMKKKRGGRVDSALEKEQLIWGVGGGRWGRNSQGFPLTRINDIYFE